MFTKRIKMDNIVFYIRILLLLLSLTIVFGSETEYILYEIDDDLEAMSHIGNIVSDFNLESELGPAVLSNLSYSFLSDGIHTDYFALDSKSGDLSTKAVVDRDSDELCRGALACALPIDIALHSPQHFQKVKAVIDIKDRNDHVPQFDQDSVIYEILESTPPGVIGDVSTANDPDSPIYGVTKYMLETNTDAFSLNVRNNSGTFELLLRLNSALDRETEDNYLLKVLACEEVAPYNTGTLTLQIQVLDVNDNSPQFESGINEVHIPENLNRGSVIFTVLATDDDLGQNGQVSYSFHPDTISDIGGAFSIGGTSGEITVEKRLDFEIRESYSLIVIARDGGQDSLPTSTRVLVHIRDINDNRPTIANNTLPPNRVIEIEENNEVSAFIAHISVIDLDHDKSGYVECFLSGDENRFEILEVYEKEFKIIATVALDYEEQDTYVLGIRCQDYGIPPLSVSDTLTVKVLNINDNPPNFSFDTYSVTLQENNPVPIFIVRVEANDVETGDSIRYSIGSAAADLFEINRFNGEIRALRSFDREEEPIIQFEVIASDTGNPVMSSTATIMLELLDVNDNMPTFTSRLFALNVSENMPPREQVGRVVAIDNDAAPNNELFYFLEHSESAVDSFTIDPLTGFIYTKRLLDREKQAAYSFTVLVHSGNSPNDGDSAIVEISILDQNDNAPIITFPGQAPHNAATVSNLAGAGYHVTRILAYDYDDDINGQIGYEIVEGNDNGYFRVDYQTGDILLAKDIDEVADQRISLKIMVRDLGTTPRVSFAFLDIVINSSAPIRPNQGQTDAAAVKVDKPRDSVAVIVGCICGALIIVLCLVLAVVLIIRRRKQGVNTPFYTAQPSTPTKEDIIDFQTTDASEQNCTNTANSLEKGQPDVTGIPIKMGNGRVPMNENKKEQIKTGRSPPPRSLQLSHSTSRHHDRVTTEKDNDSGCADLSQGSSEETNIHAGTAVVQTKCYHPRAGKCTDGTEDKQLCQEPNVTPNTTPRLSIKQSILYNSKLQPNQKPDLIRPRSTEPAITKPLSPSLTHFNLPPPKRSPSPLSLSSHPSFTEWLQTENKQLTTQGHKYNVGRTHKRSQSQSKMPKTVRFTEPERSPQISRRVDDVPSLNEFVTSYRSPPPICIRSIDSTARTDRPFLDLADEGYSCSSLDRRERSRNTGCDAMQHPVVRFPTDTYPEYPSPEDEDGSLV